MELASLLTRVGTELKWLAERDSWSRNKEPGMDNKKRVAKKNCYELFSLELGNFVISLTKNSYVANTVGVQRAQFVCGCKGWWARRRKGSGRRQDGSMWELRAWNFEIGNISHRYFSILELEVILCVVRIRVN